jgi:hypothetical protein
MQPVKFTFAPDFRVKSGPRSNEPKAPSIEPPTLGPSRVPWMTLPIFVLSRPFPRESETGRAVPLPVAQLCFLLDRQILSSLDLRVCLTR